MNYWRISLSPSHATYLSFWQSPTWQEILLNSWQAEDVFYFGNYLSFLLVEIRSVGKYKAAFSLWTQEKQLSFQEKGEFLRALKEYLSTIGCLFYHIESFSENILPRSRYHYRSFLMPYTRILDTTLKEEELLADMHEKCRYNIRLAEKRWVEVRSVAATEENITTWMNLLTLTTQRDWFHGNSRSYYETFIKAILQWECGELLFAYFEGRVIAASIVVYTNNRAIYYYGASSSDKEDRKQMAPYLLQWKWILESKRRGIPVYDFLWVADPDNPYDSLVWVTEFKEKFGWKTIRDAYSTTIPLNMRGKILLIFRKLLQKKRH